jgi:hypothetical protein
MNQFWHFLGFQKVSFVWEVRDNEVHCLHSLAVRDEGSNYARQRKESKKYDRAFCTTCRSTATYKPKWTAANA